MNTLRVHPMLTQPPVLASLAATALIVLGSGVYYFKTVHAFDTALALPHDATAGVITASGVVAPSQNPDLGFQSAGKIVHIAVATGDVVQAGQVLASLNTALLRAQRAQGYAALAAQQAKLDGVLSGTRPEDIAISQAAAEKAVQDLTNMYATVPDVATDAFTKANDAVRVQLDPLFSSGETSSPTLNYATNDLQEAINAVSQRMLVSQALNEWQAALATTDETPEARMALLQKNLVSLRAVHTLLTTLSSTLESPSGLTASTTAAYKMAVTTALNEVNTATKNLNTLMQGVASQKLVLAQAQAQLELKKAGATAQDISAQRAQVDGARASIAATEAQIANATIVAPFSGTVSSVHKKVGDVVTADVPIISLTPRSALQLIVYVSEIDAAHVAAGASVGITLDAYGTDRTWHGTVVTVDHSPTQTGSGMGYKVVVQFNGADPAITSGMTANVRF